MKFIKKVLISFSIILILFSSIFGGTRFVKKEVHAFEAVSALPILAANPELIPVFAIGFFALMVCKVTADNFDKIIAMGNHIKQAIEASGKALTDFVHDGTQIVVNEALKQILVKAIEEVPERVNVNYKTEIVQLQDGSYTVTDFINFMQYDGELPDTFLNNEAGQNYLVKPNFVPTEADLSSETRAYPHPGIVFSDNPSSNVVDEVKTSSDGYPMHNKYVETKSLTFSFTGKIPKATPGEYPGYEKNISSISIKPYSTNEYFPDELEFTFPLNYGLSSMFIQKLLAEGILYEPTLDSEGNVTSFTVTILKRFFELHEDWQKFNGISEVQMKWGNMDESYGMHYSLKDIANTVSLNAMDSAFSTRSIDVMARDLTAGKIEKAAMANALDIAFPNERENLFDLDKTALDTRVLDNLADLDRTRIDSDSRFFTDEQANQLDAIYKTGSNAERLQGIDHVRSNTGFTARDYALDKTKIVGIADKDYSTATDNANANAGTRTGTFEGIPILQELGKLWDWLREIVGLLKKILEAIIVNIASWIADMANSITRAISDLIAAVRDFAKEFSAFFVADIIIGDLDELGQNFNALQKTLSLKFPNLKPLNLSIQEKDSFDDFTADIPYAGHVTIVRGDIMTQFARTAKPFFAGLFYFLTGLFFFRKFHKVSED